MAKANMKAMDKLHGVLAEYYTELLDGALENDEQLSSGTLAALNTFLKNNNITADPVEASPMQSLQDKIQQMIKEEV
jgi:hypothetical protein